MRAWDDPDLLHLGRAFDRAWDQFLRTGMLTAENMSDTRDILARVRCYVLNLVSATNGV